MRSKAGSPNHCAKASIYKFFDRIDAINKAVALARPGDVIIGTGKGSEDWIHIAGGKKIPWNERAASRRRWRGSGRGDKCAAKIKKTAQVR